MPTQSPSLADEETGLVTDSDLAKHPAWWGVGGTGPALVLGDGAFLGKSGRAWPPDKCGEGRGSSEALAPGPRWLF